MAGAAQRSQIRKELKELESELERHEINCIIDSILGAGYCSLADFQRDGNKMIPTFHRVNAGGKAILRKLCREHCSADTQVKQPLLQGSGTQQRFKTASAETVLKSINVASAMKVERPTEKPLQMIERLQASCSSDSSKKMFIEISRLEALCGNMVSIRETSTAVRCWRKFGLAMGLVVHDRELPPTVTGLLAWSRIFAVKGTFANYLSKLALACEIAGVSKQCFEHPSVKRAKATIGSLQAPPKPKRGLRLPLLEKLVTLATMEKDMLSVLLYILSYAFLLRVPSEGLPVTIEASDESCKPLKQNVTSRLTTCSDKVMLRLRRRKNRPTGSVMTRQCWCGQSEISCPVHAIRSIIDMMPGGYQPFKHINGQDVLILLRKRLGTLGVPHAQTYETKDFRRGHARDLIERPGGCLKEVMQMGQWKSSALLAYLDPSEVEEKAVVEAHIAESDSEGELE